MFHLRAALVLSLLASARPPLVAGAAPPDKCKVTCRVVSTEYSKMGGTLDRSIVWVLTARDNRRQTDSSSTEHRFEFDLAPGDYILQCTGVGSRGATFQPTYQPFTVKAGEATRDLGTVDMPVNEVTRLFGKQAPELAGVAAWRNTAPVSLKEQRGKIVVLDFWAYYCSICIHHMPDLAKLADKYTADRLRVLTIHDGSVASLAEMDGHLRETSRKKLGTLPIALDRNGSQCVFQAYGIRAVPALILIDTQGKVVRRFHHVGDPELDRAIGELVRAPQVALADRESKLWAAISISKPLFLENEAAERIQVQFTLVNDGDMTLDPQIGASQLFVNGKELSDWAFIVGNGPKSPHFQALPAGEHIQFGYSLGEHFKKPGIYQVSWKGKAFESPAIVFRVMPKKVP
jgi:thiol-disulfide isomerase/thioredoxin